MNNAALGQWRPAPADLVLPANEVHIWRASLDLPPQRISQLRQLLAPGESEKAGKYRFPKDRDRYIATQGLLRRILSRYTHIEPHRLQFQEGPYGKPSLSQRFCGDELSFNLSHSAGLALYAVARNRRVGIDIEAIRHLADAELIAQHFFTPHEAHTLRSLPPAQQQEAFFLCWTRKEAYIKARGEGLALPLNRFEVTLVPGEPVRLVKTEEGMEETMRWSLRALSPGPGWAATVVAEGNDWDAQYWHWQE